MNLGDLVKMEVEKAVKAAVEAHSDQMMTVLLEELKKVTPELVDVVIDTAKPKMLPIVKAELLKLADKISDQI